MRIKNTQQMGLGRWLTPAQYWASPEGQHRKERRRLDQCAATPRDMTPRLIRNPARPEAAANHPGPSARGGIRSKHHHA